MISRIKSIIEYSGLSVRAFAVKIGLNQPSLDRMLKGINALNLSCVSAILSTFPEISSEWLMRGEGEMLKGDVSTKEIDRLNKLIDTIATLQDVINDKSEALAIALERIRQLENNKNNQQYQLL